MNASHQPISFLDARRRRAEAEATEIALRAAHRRRGIPVIPLIADSKAFARQSGHLSMIQVMVLFWICALLFALAALGMSLLIGWVSGQVDGQAVLDFVAPTAAQARDTGWVALSEGL
ncbi:hypothetical protein [Paracoccus sp. (in: a-proteobacteria)]|uniref:hypothetical protein n=1 Tax=Paracoccus sp. TaxID=267 RepID=UPI0028ABA720|nr:hypothetical protein [Paracoccus sp. (in: a-proteobacteria)]